MRVLVTADQLSRPVPGGIGTYVGGLAKGLRESGVDAALWTTRERSTLDVGLPVVASRLPVPLLTWAWDHGLGRPPRGFDVVHATSLAVPPRGASPMTVFVHDLAWRTLPDAFPPRGRRWHEAALRRAVERADILMTPSSATASELLRQGVEAGRVEVVPEGCDHLPPPDHLKTGRRLKEAGVTGEFILAVGTLEPRKNLARLVEAYSEASRSFPEKWPLVVVGPAGWGDAFRPPEGVIALGHTDASVVASLYERCRVFVSVPLLEGYGLPVVEAMAAGAPVISSPVPSAGDASLEVSPTDVDEIASAIALVATDAAVRDDLRARGRRHASRLTWKASAAEHIRIWETVCR